ncbi:MAG: hypothetical protein RIM84_06555 [Alphaproteobacteria bacterium]
MSQAYISCPTTRREVYVGLNVEWLQLDSLSSQTERIECPHCGKTHEFSKQDLLLRADGAG